MDHETALITACTEGRADVVKRLLDEYYKKDDDLSKAYKCACSNDRVDCVRVIVDWQPKVVSNSGMSPKSYPDKINTTLEQLLIQAVAKGDQDAVESLIAGGVTPKPDSYLLHWASTFGREYEILNILVQAGWSVNELNAEGNTCLHEAAAAKHLETIRALLRLGANPDIKDRNGATVFDMCPEIRDESVQASFSPKGKVFRDGQKKPLLEELVEEQKITIDTLKKTIELLLDEQGVLKYITKLQNDYKELEDELQATRDAKNHLKQIYMKCDGELEKALDANASFRVHSQSSLRLENESQTISNTDNNQTALIESITKERDRLATELEAERRLRFSEARLHIRHTEKLQEQMSKLKGLSIETEAAPTVSVPPPTENVSVSSPTVSIPSVPGKQSPSSKSKPPIVKTTSAPPGILSSMYSAFFGGESGEEDDDDEEEDDDEEDEESPSKA